MILNGSPRKNGNTELLVDNFIEGAKEVGHYVTNFNLREMNIHPCIGCLKGGKDKQSPCVQKDDMDKIYSSYKEADIFVMASPMYYWSFTAQFKMALDRLFAVTEANDNNTPFKECVMLVAAEGDDEENFAPMVDYYQKLLKHLGWQDKGMVLAGGVMEIGDIEGMPSLAQAKELGQTLA